MIRFPSILLLAVLSASPLLAQATAPGLTLAETLSMGLEQSPEVRGAMAMREVAEARLGQARSTWLPLIRASETWTESDNPVFVFGTLLEQGRFAATHFDPAFLNDPDPIDNWRLALSIQMPVFDQLRRWSRIDQARLGLDAEALRFEATREARAFELLRLFDAAVLADAEHAAASQRVAAAESDVSAIRDRFETGLVVESDLLGAEVQLAEFRTRMIGAAGEREAARAALFAAVGMPIDSGVTVTGSLELPDRSVPPLDELVSAAQQSRADVSGSRIAERAAALETRIARGSFLPRVDAFATFGASGSSIDETNGDRTWGAVVSIDVLQPGRLGRLAEARAGELAAQADADRIERDAQTEVVTAYHRYQAALSQVEVAELAVQQAEQALRIIRDRYSEGLTTITEQLRAHAARLAAENQLLAARSQARSGRAALLLSAGLLDPMDPLGGTR
jgi:outer membrane protein